MPTGRTKPTAGTRSAKGDPSQPATRTPRRLPADERPGEGSYERLIADLRRARQRYLVALERAYRAGLSPQRLRAEGAVGRELE